MTEDQIKQVKMAWANGDIVQIKPEGSDMFQDWNCDKSISLNVGSEWRVKPKTIKVNGIEVPKPLDYIEVGKRYYYYVAKEVKGFLSNEFDAKSSFLRGRCYEDESDARAYAQAASQFTTKED